MTRTTTLIKTPLSVRLYCARIILWIFIIGSGVVLEIHDVATHEVSFVTNRMTRGY
jgi:hypothetical protein